MCKYGYTLPDGGSILSSRSRRFVGDNAVNLPPSEVDPNYQYQFLSLGISASIILSLIAPLFNCSQKLFRLQEPNGSLPQELVADVFKHCV